MRHKTIICDPSEFDKEFINWKKSLILIDDQRINKCDIKHDGNKHYILYTFNWEFAKDKEK